MLARPVLYHLSHSASLRGEPILVCAQNIIGAVYTEFLSKELIPQVEYWLVLGTRIDRI
jgi:hypothetical protein